MTCGPSDRPRSRRRRRRARDVGHKGLERGELRISLGKTSEIQPKRLTVAQCRCRHTLPVWRLGCKALRWGFPTGDPVASGLLSEAAMNPLRRISAAAALATAVVIA